MAFPRLLRLSEEVTDKKTLYEFLISKHIYWIKKICVMDIQYSMLRLTESGLGMTK
jgi:hypothetical protein